MQLSEYRCILRSNEMANAQIKRASRTMSARRVRQFGVRRQQAWSGCANSAAFLSAVSVDLTLVSLSYFRPLVINEAL